jgi:tetratricopeptide (TPR) repeat protein
MPNNKTKAKSLELIGSSYQYKERYDQAYKKLTEAHDLCDSLEMNVEKSNIQHILGLFCFAMRYYEMGIFHQNRFVEFNQKTNNELNVYKGHVALNTLYREIEKYDLATSKLDYVIDNMKEDEKTSTLFFAYYHRGYTAYKQNKFSLAKSDYEKALVLSGDSYWLHVFVHNALGDLYKERHIDSSLIFYEKAIEYNKQQNSKVQYVHSLLGIGDCFVKKNQSQNAIQYYNEALKVSQKNGFTQHSIEAANHLRNIYTSRKDWQKGNDYADIEMTSLERLLSYHVEQSLLIDNGILMEKQLEHIKYVESKNKLSKLRNQLLISVLILFVVIILFIGVTIYNLRQRNKLERKKSEELELLTVKLKDSYETLESVNNRLEVSNNDLNNFAALAAHDLKAPLRTVGSVIKIIERGGKNKFSNNDNEMFQFVINSSSKMSQMIQVSVNEQLFDLKIKLK